MSFIELKNVYYRYPLEKKNALCDISYNFQQGKFYGITGENGGGKTTLCNLIRGLIPHFYKGDLKGSVLIDNQDIRDIDVNVLSTQIGYIFQNPFTQISGIKKTVFEEIAMGLENLGVPKNEIIDRVVGIVELLGIEDLIKKNPNRLSGGQKQRVAFASIIIMDPKVLVIDEPTSQLDPKGTDEVFKILHMLKEKGKTVILVEHKIDLIAEYVDEVLVLKNGNIVASGKTKNILSNPEIVTKGAMIPQVALLGNELIQSGIGLKEVPITNSQCLKFLQKELEG